VCPLVSVWLKPLPQHPADFLFDLGLQRGKQESEPRFHPQLTRGERDLAVHARAFEQQALSLPVARQAKSRAQGFGHVFDGGTGLFRRQGVDVLEVDFGHADALQGG